MIFFKNVSPSVLPQMSHFIWVIPLCVFYKVLCIIFLNSLFSLWCMDKKKVAVSLFILFIMIFSVFGLVLYYAVPPQPPLEYNGFKFTVLQSGFQSEIGGVDRQFLFFPQDIEYISLSDEVKSALNQPVWTVAYNPQDVRNSTLGEAQYYLEFHLSDKRTIERALTNVTVESLPQKSCADATESQPVVLIEFANETGVFVENNCVRISSLSDLDLVRGVERVIYHVLGVMK